jgi:hypothetical protein
MERHTAGWISLSALNCHVNLASFAFRTFGSQKAPEIEPDIDRRTRLQVELTYWHIMDMS